MNLRIWSPRLFLRAVRALERTAAALEDANVIARRVHHQPALDAPRIESDPDTDDDQAVSYTDPNTIWERQQRAQERVRLGFPADDVDLPPRN